MVESIVEFMVEESHELKCVTIQGLNISLYLLFLLLIFKCNLSKLISELSGGCFQSTWAPLFVD